MAITNNKRAPPLTEEQLTALAGVPIKLIDRNLPYEEKFSQTPFTDFTDSQYEAREEALYKQVPSLRPIKNPNNDRPDELSFLYKSRPLGHFSSVPLCSTSTTMGRHLWTRHAIELGKEIFGEQFDELNLDPREVTKALISPVSPCLTREGFWEHHLGFKIKKTPNFTIEEIALLHEVGHVLFSFDHMIGNESGYLSEVMPDVFAVKTFLKRGGNPEVIHAHVHARRMHAFLGLSSPDYWTAAACEAAVEGKRIPSSTEAYYPLREVQVRTYAKLKGIDVISLDQKALEENHPTLGNEIKKYDFSYIHNVWKVRARFFDEYFAGLPMAQVMGALKDVLKDSIHLSPETQAEGKKILAAYDYFRPIDAKLENEEKLAPPEPEIETPREPENVAPAEPKAKKSIFSRLRKRPKNYNEIKTQKEEPVSPCGERPSDPHSPQNRHVNQLTPI